MAKPEIDPRRRAALDAYFDFGRSDMGRVILADLEKEFDGVPYAQGDANHTAYACGCMYAYRYILRQIADAGNPQPRQETVDGTDSNRG